MPTCSFPLRHVIRNHPAASRGHQCRGAIAASRWLLALALIATMLLLPASPTLAQEQPAEPGQPAQPVEPAAAQVTGPEQIVYADSTGHIRVADPFGKPQVQFVSPDGGYTQVAVGDFNRDGDEEIVAISNQANNRRLTIYDPVVTSGPVDPDHQYNGIPWRMLYTRPLTGDPELVGVGDFDPSSPGPEIVVSEGVPSNTTPGAKDSHVFILTQAGGPGDGTAWRELSGIETTERWTSLAAGQLIAPGPDDLALVDNDHGVLSLYHVINGNLTRYYIDQTDTRPWQDVAIGQVDATDPTSLPELVLVRRADTPLPSLVVWRWDAQRGKFADATLRAFAPSPRVVWLANINGTRNSAIFMLRNVNRTTVCNPASPTPPAQLLMRRVHEPTAQPPLLDLCLDQANAFRYGASGDLDGDGKQDIAVISPGQIRYFTNLANAGSTISFGTIPVNSNADTIAIGKLNASGYVTYDTLAVSPSTGLTFTVPAGEQSTAAQTVVIGNSATTTPIPLVIHTSAPAPYLRWTLSSATTPATLSVSVDASDLLPKLNYAAEILIDSGAGNVINAPVKVPVLVKVDAGLVLRPSGVNLVSTDCGGEQPPNATATLPITPTIDLRVIGTLGTPFGATIQGPSEAAAAAEVQPSGVISVPSSLPWITSAVAISDKMPSTITLTLDTRNANKGNPSPFNQAVVNVSGGNYTRSAVITLVCASPDGVLYFPYVHK